MQLAGKIAPCLWFDDQAEAAAKFYTAVFPDSNIVLTSRYSDAGREIHGRPAGSVMTVEFEIAGQPFTALNGGPHFRFNEAISFQILCQTQEEIDYYWTRLCEGGQEVQCGWLKDRFGVSWQVVPKQLSELLKGGNTVQSSRAMEAMLRMKKLDIAELQRAYDGR